MNVATKTPPLRRGGYYWLPVKPEMQTPVGVKLNGTTWPYDAVTTVLRFPDAPGRDYWQREQDFLRYCSDPERFNSFDKVASAAREALESAADRGSTVHSLAEALDAGGEIRLEDVPEKFRGYAQALVQFERDHRPITLHTEATVFNATHGYAGTCDRICEIGGRTVLLDRKTSKSIYTEMKLQVTAYANAEFLMTKGADAETIPMPHIEATAILLLRADGTYAYEPVTAPFEAFLRLLWLYRYFKGEGK